MDRGDKAAGERRRDHLSVEGGLDTESGTSSFDPSVEMDTDLTYNTDQQQGTHNY